MNRTEELRQQMVARLEADIDNYENDCGKLDDDAVEVDIITARRTVELLKKLEAPVEAKWHGYTNEEGKARWKCTNCGKLVRRRPSDKKRCSWCGAYMSEEA